MYCAQKLQILFLFPQPLLESVGIREMLVPNSVRTRLSNTFCGPQNPFMRICYLLLPLYIGEVRGSHDPVSAWERMVTVKSIVDAYFLSIYIRRLICFGWTKALGTCSGYNKNPLRRILALYLKFVIVQKHERNTLQRAYRSLMATSLLTYKVYFSLQLTHKSCYLI